jgi:hypothetical protein
MYAESLTGAVDIRDEDDDQLGSVGDYMFTPMYTYVYDYRYRSPPAYSEVSIYSTRFVDELTVVLRSQSCNCVVLSVLSNCAVTSVCQVISYVKIKKSFVFKSAAFNVYV